MRVLRRLSFLVLALLPFLVGCATGTGPDNSVVRDVAPDSISNIRTTGPETPDLLSCSSELASDLLALPAVAGAIPYCRMALREVKNLSVFRFDPEIISDQMRHLLMEHCGGRIRFVERSRGGEFAEVDTAVLGEREMKRSGMVDGGAQRSLAGVDFFLSGTIRSHTVVTGGGRDDAVFISFTLQDTETGELVWEHSYGPIRKVAEKSRLYRSAD